MSTRSLKLPKGSFQRSIFWKAKKPPHSWTSLPGPAWHIAQWGSRWCHPFQETSEPTMRSLNGSKLLNRVIMGYLHLKATHWSMDVKLEQLIQLKSYLIVSYHMKSRNSALFGWILWILKPTLFPSSTCPPYFRSKLINKKCPTKTNESAPVRFNQDGLKPDIYIFPHLFPSFKSSSKSVPRLTSVMVMLKT